jgi:hypothetical protein
MLALYPEYATIFAYFALLRAVISCPLEDAVRTEVEPIKETFPPIA